ncbi:MAG TPA: amidohydrolase family protein, partial [Myxococcaceae bacterium]
MHHDPRALRLASILRVVLLVAPLFARLAVAAEPVTVVRAARLYDGKAEAIVTPGVVVVSEGRIVAAGSAATVPSGARVIDLGDATLLPGLIDAHTHLSFESSLDWKQDQLDGLKRPIPEQALRATEYTRRTLLAGFTTVRDVGSSDLIDVSLRNAINAGTILGPRMVVAVNAIGSRGGHCDPTGGFRPELLKEPGPEQG